MFTFFKLYIYLDFKAGTEFKDFINVLSFKFLLAEFFVNRKLKGHHLNSFKQLTLSSTSFVGEEKNLVSRLGTTGPVAAAVDASTWNNYVGGIIQFHCANYTNHAVEIVGYDRTGEAISADEYTLIKVLIVCHIWPLKQWKNICHNNIVLNEFLQSKIN